MGNDACSGSTTQLGDAADVVGMPVRQQDGVHLANTMSSGLDSTRHCVGPSRDPGVDQDDSVVDHNGIGIHISDGDLKDAIHHFAHVVIVTCGPAYSRHQLRQAGDRAASS